MYKLPNLGQRGVVAHFLLFLLLVMGLIFGVYLIQKGPLKIFPKAVSVPTGPETSFSLIGSNECASGWMCALELIMPPQPQEEFNVKLYARSDIEAANLFTAKMTFPKDLVSVKVIQTDGTFIQNWVENFYDNNTGEISLVGGVPSPGFQTYVGRESALMATIVFSAKTVGQGSVTFKDTSAIYSNLNNINILTIKRPYNISVEVKPSPTPTPVSAPLPSPSCEPRPACMDDRPPCELNEPVGGWCPASSPVVTSLTVTNLTVATPPNPLGVQVDITCQPASARKIVAGIFSFGDRTPDVTFPYSPYGPGVPVNISDSHTYQSFGSYNITVRCKDDANNVSDPKSQQITLNPLSPTPTPTPLISPRGDANGDGKIDLVDMSILHSDWMKTRDKASYHPGIDMNSDGVINSFDFSLLKALLVQLGVIRVR